MSAFSDYIIYADESGDHSLTRINARYPVFCLALCLIKKEEYIHHITPAIQQLKFDFWGHDKIVLHERDIRKQEGDFAFLRTNKALRETFMHRLNSIIQDANFTVISCVVKKAELTHAFASEFNNNPYHIALKSCMEQVRDLLYDKNHVNNQLTFIFEARGKEEDKQLELEFYRKLNERGNYGYPLFDGLSCQIKFANKHHNSTGLQLADLIARPIGLNVLFPDQSNRAYDIIKRKYDEGCENRIFPA